jgi:hypothetical protein
MSQKMRGYILKELRGEIPGLKGDVRFGATVTPDVNNSRMVDQIAIEHQEEEIEGEEEEDQSELMLSDTLSD